MAVQIRYNPVVIPVDTAVSIKSQMIGQFHAKTAGTITIVDTDGVTILNAFPVTAGAVIPINLYIGEHGGTFTTAGGAGGTLGV